MCCTLTMPFKKQINVHGLRPIGIGVIQVFFTVPQTTLTVGALLVSTMENIRLLLLLMFPFASEIGNRPIGVADC